MPARSLGGDPRATRLSTAACISVRNPRSERDALRRSDVHFGGSKLFCEISNSRASRSPASARKRSLSAPKQIRLMIELVAHSNLSIPSATGDSGQSDMSWSAASVMHRKATSSTAKRRLRDIALRPAVQAVESCSVVGSPKRLCVREKASPVCCRVNPMSSGSLRSVKRGVMSAKGPCSCAQRRRKPVGSR